MLRRASLPATSVLLASFLVAAYPASTSPAPRCTGWFFWNSVRFLFRARMSLLLEFTRFFHSLHTLRHETGGVWCCVGRRSCQILC